MCLCETDYSFSPTPKKEEPETRTTAVQTTVTGAFKVECQEKKNPFWIFFIEMTLKLPSRQKKKPFLQEQGNQFKTCCNNIGLV